MFYFICGCGGGTVSQASLRKYVSSYHHVSSYCAEGIASSYYCMCPHTTVYVSSYYYVCVLILLYVSSYCCMCVLILLCMCPHTTVYTTICVLILLYVSSYLYICVLLPDSRRRAQEVCACVGYVSSLRA